MKQRSPRTCARAQPRSRHYASWPASVAKGTSNQTLRALLHAGAQAVGERVLDVGYAELAAEFNSEPASAERRTARDRHVRRSRAER